MAYLTYNEYVEITTEPVEEADFDKLLKAASNKLDLLTNYFFQYHDLEQDLPMRKRAFKEALTYLIDYYNFNGSSYSFESNTALSVTIGRTQQSVGDRNQNKINVDIPKEVFDLLNYWGFLFRGVGTTQC